MPTACRWTRHSSSSSATSESCAVLVDTIERDEMVKSVVFGLACLLVGGEAAQAAQCGSSLYLELMSRAKTIDKISGTCSRAARRSHPIPAICKVCGPTVHQL